MRILFLTDSREDYLADSLLHGLISLGMEVVDFPRKHILYKSTPSNFPASNISVRGNGFTLYGLLPERQIDRSFVFQRLEARLFDLVVVGQVWRQWGQLLDLAPLLQKVPVVLLDGDDDIRIFHRSGTRIRRYGWQPFPIRSGRCFYLKREWQGDFTEGRWCRVLPASFSIPSEKIRPINLAIKHKCLGIHCVDPEVSRACGLHTTYAFTSEEAYYDDLSESMFAVTTKRGGWDCLRHYEIAAAGAVPCIRQLDRKPLSCAPHNLQAGLNCLTYQDWPDLHRQLTYFESNPLDYKRLIQSVATWVRDHTTTSAANRLLHSVLTP